MPTPEEILDATEEVLRRFGPGKANVVDVARALGVSHGTIYRHYSSKAALWDAVTRRWLRRVERPLADIAKEDGSAHDRLYRWLVGLASIKREKRREDPEMFATYYALAEKREGMVGAHVEELIDQLMVIVADGKAEGTFQVKDSVQAAQAVFEATSLFHHPARAREWDDPAIEERFEAVWQLVRSGLLP